MLGPLQAAQARGIRTATFVHSFWAFFGELLPQSPLTMAAPYERQPAGLLRQSDEVWVATDRTLDPVAQAVPGNVFWVGVAQPPAQPARPRNRGRALISLSTVWFPGQQECMQRIVDAVGELPIEVVATIDDNIDAELLRILPTCRRSVHRPRGRNADGGIGHRPWRPRDNDVRARRRVAAGRRPPASHRPAYCRPPSSRTGAGIALAKDADASEIQQAVTTMLESDEPADAANAIGERIRARSGTLVAVERAEALLNDQVPA
jgi:hypothetical protein